MFARRYTLELVESGEARAVPKAWLDQFFMRNFIGYSAFDETLAVGDGELEASYAVPEREILERFETWLRGRKMIPPSTRLRLRIR